MSDICHDIYSECKRIVHVLVRHNRRFHIEYGGFLTNHATQWAVVLWKLIHEWSCLQSNANTMSNDQIMNPDIHTCATYIRSIVETYWNDHKMQSSTPAHAPSVISDVDRDHEQFVFDTCIGSIEHYNTFLNFFDNACGIQCTTQLPVCEECDDSRICDSCATASIASLSLAEFPGSDSDSQPQSQSQSLSLSDQAHKMVAQYFPKLYRRMPSAALHGLIHLGFADEAEDPVMIAEGLAYLASGSLAVQAVTVTVTTAAAVAAVDVDVDDLKHTKQLNIDARSIFMDAVQFAQKHDLYHAAKTLAKTSPTLQAKKVGTFQTMMHALLGPQATSTAQAYIAYGNISRQLERSSYSQLRQVVNDVSKLVAQLYKYSSNDFFVIHACTSWHALKNLLSRHGCTTESEVSSTSTKHGWSIALQSQMIACWFQTALATYCAQGFPGATEALNFNTMSRCQSAQSQSQSQAQSLCSSDTVTVAAASNSACDSATDSGSGIQHLAPIQSWTTLLRRSCDATDEHTSKLVYALYVSAHCQTIPKSESREFLGIAHLAITQGDRFRYG
jgi:Questin oxidase-like